MKWNEIRKIGQDDIGNKMSKQELIDSMFDMIENIEDSVHHREQYEKLTRILHGFVDLTLEQKIEIATKHKDGLKIKPYENSESKLKFEFSYSIPRGYTTFRTKTIDEGINRIIKRY